MKKYTIFLMLFSFTSFFYCCKKEGRKDYIDLKAPAPEQISDMHITSTPGGAIITYKTPHDSSFYYAKAVYEIQPNVFREAKASYYTDTLNLVGFGDTLQHEVKIYSVGKNEKESEAIPVTVTPLMPPVQSVFKTLMLVPTFGGVQVSFENSSGANLAIVVLKDTTGLNTWSTVNTFYTRALEGQFSSRGFDSTKQKFAVFIRDRWNNKSDTLEKSLSPLFEEPIPKDKWQALHLNTDTYQPAEAALTLERAWDGSIAGYDVFATPNASTLPQWFTIDLGQKVIISRVVEHQQSTAHLYAASAVKTFELWGSNNPDPNGSWNSWDSLGTFHSFKPSGLPMGQVSDEDKNYGWLQGEDFDFDHILPAYRYIRWKTLETYGSSGQIVIAEIDLYGQIQP